MEQIHPFPTVNAPAPAPREVKTQRGQPLTNTSGSQGTSAPSTDTPSSAPSAVGTPALSTPGLEAQTKALFTPTSEAPAPIWRQEADGGAVPNEIVVPPSYNPEWAGRDGRL
jgi:hypothetical protein